MVVWKLEFDWFYTIGEGEGEGCSTHEVGKNGVTSIKDDNGTFLVSFENGEAQRIFNPSRALYREEA